MVDCARQDCLEYAVLRLKVCEKQRPLAFIRAFMVAEPTNLHSFESGRRSSVADRAQIRKRETLEPQNIS